MIKSRTMADAACWISTLGGLGQRSSLDILCVFMVSTSFDSLLRKRCPKTYGGQGSVPRAHQLLAEDFIIVVDIGGRVWFLTVTLKRGASSTMVPIWRAHDKRDVSVESSLKVEGEWRWTGVDGQVRKPNNRGWQMSVSRPDKANEMRWKGDDVVMDPLWTLVWETAVAGCYPWGCVWAGRYEGRLESLDNNCKCPRAPDEGQAVDNSE